MMPPTPAPPDPGALLRVAATAGLAQHVGACRHPIPVTGASLLVERGTGRVLDRVDNAHASARVVWLRCRNRRAGVCPACSALYKLDAYHLIAAGLLVVLC